MRYIHATEEKKFSKEKKRENEVLRLLGVNEEIIQKLYDYDRKMFLINRSFHENEIYMEEEKYKKGDFGNLKVSLIIYDVLPLETADDIKFALNMLYPKSVVEKIDNDTLNAVILRINGNNAQEIAKELGLSVNQVYYIFSKLKKYLKKSLKSD
jgi:RNA polymerase sigma-70 factor (ECF subfamily)